MALNRQIVNLLALGVKRFLNDNHIGKKKAEYYYKALTDKENFNICSSCPLNDKFGIERAGCNSFFGLPYRDWWWTSNEFQRDALRIRKRVYY